MRAPAEHQGGADLFPPPPTGVRGQGRERACVPAASAVCDYSLLGLCAGEGVRPPLFLVSDRQVNLVHLKWESW